MPGVAYAGLGQVQHAWEHTGERLQGGCPEEVTSKVSPGLSESAAQRREAEGRGSRERPSEMLWPLEHGGRGWVARWLEMGQGSAFRGRAMSGRAFRGSLGCIL